jgi:hypothetical protein
MNAAHIALAVVLDPEGIVDMSALDGAATEVGDWWAMRASYERQGRRRAADAGQLALVVRGPLALEPLPFDIERDSGAIVSVRLPGPPAVRAVLIDLDGDERERAIRAATGAADPAAAVVGSVTGVALSAEPLSRAEQLRVAGRLAVRPRRSSRLHSLARKWVVDPLLIGLLEDPPEAGRLQTAWDAFARHGESTGATDFEIARTELAQLFAAGILHPVIPTVSKPAWASVGLRQPTKEERAKDVLVERPTPFPPTDAGGWVAVAEWWGELRCLVAAAPPEIRQTAWDAWAEVDDAFLPWLLDRYGTVLSSAARWPSAVHRIGQFLARRLRDGEAQRVLLVVLDGLGQAQWAHLRDGLSIDVAEAGSTFALVPTYTTVSRQAIFAADLPVTYPDSLWTTQPERRRWEVFWLSQGLPVTAVAYHRVRGRFPHDHIDFGATRAIGVVVNAVDDLMHTSELLGDAQLLANLDVWVANGFLADLVRRAHADGIEVWMTADHGNLECLAAGSLSEGVAIESAGKRLLRYPNRVLRDASAAQGIAWDDIPGMPRSAEPLLFAPGRLAFTNNLISVSHGGLSIDEVIVPLVRVSA